MSRGRRRIAPVVVAALVLWTSGDLLAAPARPNIVFILADDLGHGDPRCYNERSRIPTPSIDRLARQGMRFTDAHSPSSVCTPTRYALLTGRYAWRSRLKRGVLWTYGMPLIEPGRLTVAELLRRHGYTTGCIGKWHLGMAWARRDGKNTPANANRLDDAVIDLSRPIRAGPLTAGFDHYFGTDVPNFPPYCFIENDRIVGPEPTRPKPENVFGSPGRMQAGWKLEAILPALTERAVEFIKRHSASEPRRPFFLYFPLTAPHTPIVPAAPYRGKSQAGDYGDLVHQVDATVGAVMAALDGAGVADETLLIFTSDNGSPARAGDPHIRNREWAATGAVIRMFGHEPNRPWRGMKSDAWEGGHRVPFIVRWPGRVKPGTVNDSLISHVDFLATVAAALEVSLPPGSAEDSYNQLPTLTGTAAGRPIRQDLIHHSGNGLFAIRQGRWKLITGRGSGGFTRPARIPPEKLKPGEPRGQLYDLRDDRGEKKNLHGERPEVVRRLTELLDHQRKKGRSRPDPGP